MPFSVPVQHLRTLFRVMRANGYRLFAHDARGVYPKRARLLRHVPAPTRALAQNQREQRPFRKADALARALEKRDYRFFGPSDGGMHEDAANQPPIFAFAKERALAWVEGRKDRKKQRVQRVVVDVAHADRATAGAEERALRNALKSALAPRHWAGVRVVRQ